LEACDHSCHALAHLIALPSTHLSHCHKERSCSGPSLSYSATWLPADPPQRPPRPFC
jgi:hypothetical protein